MNKVEYALMISGAQELPEPIRTLITLPPKEETKMTNKIYIEFNPANKKRPYKEVWVDGDITNTYDHRWLWSARIGCTVTRMVCKSYVRTDVRKERRKMRKDSRQKRKFESKNARFKRYEDKVVGL